MLETKLSGDVIDDVQRVIELLLGVCGRQAEANSTSHNRSGGESNANRRNFPIQKFTNNGTGEMERKITKKENKSCAEQNEKFIKELQKRAEK